MPHRLLGARILDFAAQAPSAPSVSVLADSLSAVIDTVGAERFACLYLKRDPVLGGVMIDRSISNLPLDWQESYVRQGYDADDPVFQVASRGGFGFWSEITRQRSLDRRGEEVMGFARQIRMQNGFTKRVQLDGGGVAIMMAAGQHIDESPEARAALRMTFDVFANEGVRVRRLTPPENLELRRALLSAAQLKVLMLRAEGLQVKQIAAHLGKHPKTIETHVTAILRRLEARNMIEAIKTATRMNLIN